MSKERDSIDELAAKIAKQKKVVEDIEYDLKNEKEELQFLEDLMTLKVDAVSKQWKRSRK